MALVVSRSGEASLRHHLVEGAVLKGRWQVCRLLAQGGFGQIYRAHDLHSPHTSVVVKIELSAAKPALLQLDSLVLETMERRGARHFLPVLDWGSTREHGSAQFSSHFLVMPLAGRNLRELKKSTPRDRCGLATTLRVGIQMCEAVQELHAAGWLHRDIKPSNFLFGREVHNIRCLYLLDFGMARPYLDPETKQIKAPRPKVGFHGTIRYAPINAHNFQDTGRADDMWSVFYIMIEMVMGRLPWRHTNDLNTVLLYKQSLNFPSLQPTQLPGADCLTHLYQHLTKLDYYLRPDYEGIQRVFGENLREMGASDFDQFDWELPDSIDYHSVPPSIFMDSLDDGVLHGARSPPIRHPISLI